MSESEETGGEKSHEPTAKKLSDARKKGEIPRSTDVSAAAAYLGLLIALVATGQVTVMNTGADLSIFLSQPDLIAGQLLGPGGRLILGSIIVTLFLGLAGIFLIPFLAALLSLIAQQTFVIVPDKIAPKLSRISMIQGAKNKFGPTGLMEFLKAAIKMATVALVLTWILWAEADRIVGSIRIGSMGLAAFLGEMLLKMVIAVTIIAGSIAALDLMWQRFDHARKLRMSHQDLKDENKEAEGDPHLRAQRRQRGMDIATNRMLVDVPNAEVVIVNPTHFAVALTWSRAPGSAPVVVAKGTDEIAARIRDRASAAGVPIHRDPPTARALHAGCEIGAEIQPELYRAVAAAIQFAEKMRSKAKMHGWQNE